jgi:hypothetical protein
MRLVADPVSTGPLPPAVQAVALALPPERLLLPPPHPLLLELEFLLPPAQDVDPESSESAAREAERTGSL